MTSLTNRTRTGRGRSLLVGVLVLAGVLVVAAVLVAVGGSSGGEHASKVGEPPPEWGANAAAWPAHNYDLANTRATSQTPINSQTVSKLKVKWTFAFKGASGFGAFSS